VHSPNKNAGVIRGDESFDCTSAEEEEFFDEGFVKIK
jgi:hypothetical protein